LQWSRLALPSFPLLVSLNFTILYFFIFFSIPQV
jgi:hypothetical protein